MKKDKVNYLIIAGIFFLFSLVGVSGAATLLMPYQGGTGKDTSNWTGVIRVDNGVWSTTTLSASPGGSDTQVQYNDAGSLAGASGLTYNKTQGRTTIQTLTVSGTSTIGTVVSGIWNGSAIDISSYTNLATSSPITLTGDTLGFDFGTNNTWTGTQTFQSSLTFSNYHSGFLKVNASGVLSTSTIDLTNDVSGTLSAGSYGAASIDGDDINSNIAGRSLTLTVGAPDTLDADEELYAVEIGGTYLNATTTQRIAKQIRNPITLTYFYCATNGANITIGADERASTTPNTAGTDIFSGGSVICDSDGFTTTNFANSDIATENLINIDIDSVSNTTTTLFFNFYATRND